MRPARFLVPVSLIALLAAAPAPAFAQEGTPAAGMALPACTAEPRDIEAMVAIWFDEAGTPLATPEPPAPFADDADLPDGERIEDAIAAEITAATEEWLVCMNVAGQYARGFSFLTERHMAMLGPDLSNPDQDTPEEVAALLQGQLVGTPIAGVEGMTRLPGLAGPRRPRLLEDGRVGAIWSFGGDRVFLVYQEVDGRWLIDEAIDIIDPVATPQVEATPAA